MSRRGRERVAAADVEPPGPGQAIVRAMGVRGGNLVEVWTGVVLLGRLGGRAAGAAWRRSRPRLADAQPTCPPPSHHPPEVERPDGSTFTALLPSRFHKTLWVKRGGFLIVDAPPDAAAAGGRLAGAVVAVLYDGDVRRLQDMEGVW